jgi:energy-coupling factor transporter transmembrane protein EcfT
MQICSNPYYLSSCWLFIFWELKTVILVKSITANKSSTPPLSMVLLTSFYAFVVWWDYHNQHQWPSSILLIWAYYGGTNNKDYIIVQKISKEFNLWSLRSNPNLTRVLVIWILDSCPNRYRYGVSV